MKNAENPQDVWQKPKMRAYHWYFYFLFLFSGGPFDQSETVDGENLTFGLQT